MKNGKQKEKKNLTSRLAFWESPGGQETLFYLRMAWGLVLGLTDLPP